MDELKPCPFCGEQPNWHTIRNSITPPKHCSYFLSCDGDLCLCPSTGDYRTKAEAVDAWNIRAESAADRQGYTRGVTDAIQIAVELMGANVTVHEASDAGEGFDFAISECLTALRALTEETGG